MKRMPLALNVIQKKVLCSAEKSSVIWAEPYSRSSAEPNVRSVTSLKSDCFFLGLHTCHIKWFWLYISTFNNQQPNVRCSLAAFMPRKNKWEKMVIRGSRLQKQLPIYMLSCWNVCLCNMQRLHFSHLHSLYGTRVLHTSYANLPPSAITYVTVLSSHLGQFRF